jgi:hypothetical protein
VIAALNAPDIRRVIRRADIPELSRIAVAEPVLRDDEVGTPRQLSRSFQTQITAGTGSIAITMRIQANACLSHAAHIAPRTSCRMAPGPPTKQS